LPFSGQTSPYQKPDKEDSRNMTVSKDTTNRTDTTIANQERRSKEQYEKQLQEQQVAHERLQAAREEHQKAIQQYQEALLQQQEFQRQK